MFRLQKFIHVRSTSYMSWPTLHHPLSPSLQLLGALVVLALPQRVTDLLPL